MANEPVALTMKKIEAAVALVTSGGLVGASGRVVAAGNFAAAYKEISKAVREDDKNVSD